MPQNDTTGEGGGVKISLGNFSKVGRVVLHLKGLAPILAKRMFNIIVIRIFRVPSTKCKNVETYEDYLIHPTLHRRNIKILQRY